MWIGSVPRSRRIRARHLYLATALSLLVLFRKWLYCITIVLHCFATWNIRTVNNIGTHDDGFPLDLGGLPPPPDLNITALVAARRTLAESHLTSKVSPGQAIAAQAAILEAEDALSWGPSVPESELIVPPILHQIILGMKDPVPPKWTEASESCRAIHPHWTFMEWNDQSAEEFILREHAWFHATWKSYRYTIQKADSLRYLVLYTYGGTYLDMDLACLRPLDPLRKFQFVANAAHPVGVSNGFLMVPTRSPFMQQLVGNLVLFNHFYMSAYPTVMFSTGCMYVSSHHAIYPDRDQLKVLGGERNRLNGIAVTPLFKHLGASSWHQGDAKMFVKMGKIIKSVPIFGTSTSEPKGSERMSALPELEGGHTAPPRKVQPASHRSTYIIVALLAIGFLAFLRVRRFTKTAKIVKPEDL
ncbi:hypothetical protein HKX48_004328 [Thoreauomyces humboldtii]|nr:hypothetical protein HKX48_004328 [Thoreauomyces humboldtii]